MRLNLMEHSEEIAAHRELIKEPLAERREVPLQWAVLVETQDTAGVYDVFTPLEDGGYATVTVDGALVVMDEILGEQS